jgi:hypothetical protein
MFNGGNTGYSLSDIAAVTNGNRNDDGFMNGNDWWIIILFLLFANGGWGNGFGGNNGGAGTLREEISYGLDMNGIENGIRGIQQGLCDGFYSQNSTMLQGFNGLNTQIAAGVGDIQQTLCQGFNGINIGMLTGFNGIQAQMANDALVAQQCCCDTQNLISSKFCDLNYNIATQGCDTRRAIADSTRDIIDAQNSGTRAILDFLTQDKIATLTAENQSLKFAASQAQQNVALGAMIDASTAEIIRRTGNECPIPAYVVPNPNCCYDYTVVRNAGCCNTGNYLV